MSRLVPLVCPLPCASIAQFYHELYEVNEGLDAPWTLGASLPRVNVVKQLAVQSPAQLQPMRAQLDALLQSETLAGLLGAMREARTALTCTQMRIDSLKQRWRTVTPLHLREATAARAPGLGLDLVADVAPGSAAGSTRAGGSVNLSGSARHTSASHLAARTGPLTVRALTRFRSAQLSLEPGDNLHLLDNSNKHTWKVRTRAGNVPVAQYSRRLEQSCIAQVRKPTGEEGEVPSVCCLLSTPDLDALEALYHASERLAGCSRRDWLAIANAAFGLLQVAMAHSAARVSLGAAAADNDCLPQFRDLLVNVKELVERTLDSLGAYQAGASDEERASIEQLRKCLMLLRQSALQLVQQGDLSARGTPLAQAGPALSAEQVNKLIQVLAALKELKVHLQALATPLTRQSVLAYPPAALAALGWVEQRGLTPADLGQPTAAAHSAAEQSVASLLNASREDVRASIDLLEHYRRKKEREEELRGREQSARELLAQYAAAGARRLGASDELIVEQASGRQYLAPDAGRPAVVRSGKELADGTLAQ